MTCSCGPITNQMHIVNVFMCILTNINGSSVSYGPVRYIIHTCSYYVDYCHDH